MRGALRCRLGPPDPPLRGKRRSGWGKGRSGSWARRPRAARKICAVWGSQHGRSRAQQSRPRHLRSQRSSKCCKRDFERSGGLRGHLGHSRPGEHASGHKGVAALSVVAHSFNGRGTASQSLRRADRRGAMACRRPGPPSPTSEPIPRRFGRLAPRQTHPVGPKERAKRTSLRHHTSKLEGWHRDCCRS